MTTNTTDEDECVCGDYRRDHENGTGHCKMNGLGHGFPGYTCVKFELSKTIRPQPAPTEGGRT